jgi:hypothetical protein
VSKMKKISFTILLLLFSLQSLGNTLTKTKWIESSDDTECPFFLTFEESSYTVFNDCYSELKTGVVEQGLYKLHKEELVWVSRLVSSSEILIGNKSEGIILGYKLDNNVLHLTYKNQNVTLTKR